jgi:hypothetical protein
MKKQLLLIFALLVSATLFSQETYRAMGWKLTRDIPQNELKLNLGTSVFGSFPEVAYERIINSDLSAGASLGVALDEDVYSIDVLFTPYVRWFFGGSSESLQKYGAGFFIEANGGIFTKPEEEIYNDDGTYTSSNGTVTGAGVGLALGWKYLSRNNWVGEIYFGGGRDFINDGGYPRLGITIGKRF